MALIVYSSKDKMWEEPNRPRVRGGEREVKGRANMRGRKVRKHQRQNKDIREERMKGIRDKATSFLKGAACCIS